MYQELNKCQFPFPFSLSSSSSINIFFKRLYLREKERASTSRGEEGGAEGEADSPLSREPHVGLDPGTLRS